MDTELLSVGIDIGTTTTGFILSRLHFSDTAAGFSVPQISISDKEILYKSEIYETPLADGAAIDGEKIREILAQEYKKAGVTPDMISSGAVIITGESAKKQNAAIVVQTLSAFAGDFVVATAGPDLESVIAGKGAGAQRYSEEYGITIANLDIGGGTTNLAVFRGGELAAQSCLNIGGRLLKYDRQGVITYVSPHAGLLAEAHGVSVREGMAVTPKRLQKLTGYMAEVLADVLFGDGRRWQRLVTEGSRLPELTSAIDAISFSGGVADCYYKEETDMYKYGDLGVSLAKSLAENRQFSGRRIIRPQETIRATVIGAGIYTTSVSGSTIAYTQAQFPIKNVPALLVEPQVEADCLAGRARGLTECMKRFLTQNEEPNLLLCFEGRRDMEYRQLCNLAEAILAAADESLAAECPLLVLIRADMAKALGQAINRKDRGKRTIVCIDKVEVCQGDYLDMGKPLMNGLAVPVVVKTLVF